MSDETTGRARQMNEGVEVEQPLSDDELMAAFLALPGHETESFGGAMEPHALDAPRSCTCSVERPHLRVETLATKYEVEALSPVVNEALVVVAVDTRCAITAVGPHARLQGRGWHWIELSREELATARKLVITDKQREVHTQAVAEWRRTAVAELVDAYGATPTSVRSRWTLATMMINPWVIMNGRDKKVASNFGVLHAHHVEREQPRPVTIHNQTADAAATGAASLELLRQSVQQQAQALAQQQRMLDMLAARESAPTKGAKQS